EAGDQGDQQRGRHGEQSPGPRDFDAERQAGKPGYAYTDYAGDQTERSQLSQNHQEQRTPTPADRCQDAELGPLRPYRCGGGVADEQSAHNEDEAEQQQALPLDRFSDDRSYALDAHGLGQGELRAPEPAPGKHG